MCARKLIAFSIFATALLPVLAQAADPVTVATSNAAPAAPAVKAGGKIEFATPIYDFGKVPCGTVVKYDFWVTNTGKELLEITDVRPACGCTTAGNWPRQLAPGQSGSIPIQLSTANFNGNVMKTVTINSSDSNQPTAVLQIKGSIWKALEINPTYVVFTTIGATQASESRMVRIINNLEEPLTLSELTSTHKAFRPELKTITPGKEFELHVHTVPPLTYGSVNGSIKLKTSSKETPEIVVSAYATVLQPITVVPAQLTLPGGPLAATRKVSLSIRNNQSNPITVSEPKINAEGVTAQIQEAQPGRVFNVAVSFPAGFEIAAGQKLELTLKSSHPDYPVIKVPVVQLAKTARATTGVPPTRPLPPASTLPVRPSTPAAPAK